MDKEEYRRHDDQKSKQLEQFRERNTGPGQEMTQDTGFKVSNDQRSLRAGKRGPTLLNDIHFYRKQSSFSRERVPEKVVHARGFGLYGDFELYKSMKQHTVAKFLQTPGTKTPVFCRFSNFVGSKGSKDTAVDIRGFAVKFYTEEGNYDMLSLQFPVFLLADAMKFRDVTHAAKPNPITDIPQATVAHDSFWDYVVSNQETAHMVMWLMSFRGRPRSWRMMSGWPINTFRFVNDCGKTIFVRFTWRPVLGVHSLLLDEANVIGGVDPDFHRRDIVEAVEKGAYPEYELGVQLIETEKEFAYDFDILDDTKLWPEELIPVEYIGKMTLNRQVDNFFAEEEQSSFDPATLVPGIEFTNDPVLQGRSFAYRDTDYHRLGTANINEIPVNKPISEVNTNRRDGYSKYRIDTDEVTYHKNKLAGNTPAEVPFSEGGYAHTPQPVEGHLTREFPSESFEDFFSQARLFWNSLTKVEQQDMTETFIYHLEYVKSKEIRQKNVEMWACVDYGMACVIADHIGVDRPKSKQVNVTASSPALSQSNTPHYAYTQKVAVLVGNGFNAQEVAKTLQAFDHYGVFYDIISERLGYVTAADGTKLKVDQTFKNKYAVLYDASYVVGGTAHNQVKFDQNVSEFVHEHYKHYKPIGVASTGRSFIQSGPANNLDGVVFASNQGDFTDHFVAAIAQHRFWDRT